VKPPARVAVDGHPGVLLREVLTKRNLSQAALARSSGLTQKHISRIVTGQSGVGTDAAVALEAALGVPARRWIRMQADYDVANHNKRRGRR